MKSLHRSKAIESYIGAKAVMNKGLPNLLGGNLNIKLLKWSRKALRSHLPLGGW